MTKKQIHTKLHPPPHLKYWVGAILYVCSFQSQDIITCQDINIRKPFESCLMWRGSCSCNFYKFNLHNFPVSFSLKGVLYAGPSGVCIRDIINMTGADITSSTRCINGKKLRVFRIKVSKSRCGRRRFEPPTN